MLMINNLSQLKKALQKGVKFQVIDHQMPHLIGQIREVNVVQTNGLYTIVHNNKTGEVSTANGGKGYRMDFSKASHYVFGDTVKWYKEPVGSKDNKLIMEFKIVSPNKEKSA